MAEKTRPWTPGPWVTEPAEDYNWSWVTTKEWDKDFCKEQGERTLVYCQVGHNGGPTTTGLPGSIQCGEHNARLIAAAPDLYEALEEMTDLVKMVGSMGGIQAPDQIARAEAALNKANPGR